MIEISQKQQEKLDCYAAKNGITINHAFNLMLRLAADKSLAPTHPSTVMLKKLREKNKV